jgi:hypothetical protein
MSRPINPKEPTITRRLLGEGTEWKIIWYVEYYFKLWLEGSIRPLPHDPLSSSNALEQQPVGHVLSFGNATIDFDLKNPTVSEILWPKCFVA